MVKPSNPLGEWLVLSLRSLIPLVIFFISLRFRLTPSPARLLLIQSFVSQILFLLRNFNKPLNKVEL